MHQYLKLNYLSQLLVNHLNFVEVRVVVYPLQSQSLELLDALAKIWSGQKEGRSSSGVNGLLKGKTFLYSF